MTARLSSSSIIIVGCAYKETGQNPKQKSKRTRLGILHHFSGLDTGVCGDRPSRAFLLARSIVFCSGMSPLFHSALQVLGLSQLESPGDRVNEFSLCHQPDPL